MFVLKNKRQRFSLSFEEWKSSPNKIYMNLNIHSDKEFWNFGLIRIDESLTAELLDIVKVRKLVSAEHQVCFAQGIHFSHLRFAL